VVTFNGRTTATSESIPRLLDARINVYNDKTPQWVFGVSGYFSINSATRIPSPQRNQFADTVR